MSLSKPSSPKQRPYVPPPPISAETIDEASLIERDRERRRAVTRRGRQSTILAGNVAPTKPNQDTVGVMMSLSSTSLVKGQRMFDRLFLPVESAMGIAPSRFQKKAFERHPDIADPLNLTDAGALKAQRDEDKRYAGVIKRARMTQEEINKKYGLQGNLTILGG